MTIPAHVLRDFKKLPVYQKISFGTNVIQALTDNAGTFTSPAVPLATLTATNAALSTAYTASLSGDHQAVAARDLKEAAWDDQFEQTAVYVDDLAQGDVAVILLSGFHATKTESAPAALPDAPVILSVLTNQQPGSIHVELNVQKGVTFAIIVSSDATLPDFTDGQFLISQNPKVVAVVFDSGRKVDITGLPTHAALHVSAVAVNNTGFGPVCPPVAVSTI